MRRAEPIVRWLATVVAAVACGIALIAEPFGCAVGEYEEDRDCDPSVLGWIGLGVLIAGTVASRLTSKRGLQWAGIAAAFALSWAGVFE